MAARKRTNSGTGASSSTGNSRDSEYRKKREKNNDAVKKTRAKTKETAIIRKRKVEELKKDNAKLEVQIQEKQYNIQTLKDLLIAPNKTVNQEEMIKKILEEQSDDE